MQLVLVAAVPPEQVHVGVGEAKPSLEEANVRAREVLKLLDITRWEHVHNIVQPPRGDGREERVAIA